MKQLNRIALCLIALLGIVGYLDYALLREPALPDHCHPDWCDKQDCETIPVVKFGGRLPDAFLAAEIDEKTEKALDAKRSSKWPACERAFKKLHPFCAYCGGTLNIQVHHVHQFRDMTAEQKGTDAPGGELDWDNLISLCENQPEDHHLKIGHLGNFKHSNPNVREDCAKHRAEMEALGTWVPVEEEEKHECVIINGKKVCK